MNFTFIAARAARFTATRTTNGLIGALELYISAPVFKVTGSGREGFDTFEFLPSLNGRCGHLRSHYVRWA